jgi:hypothetical protein
MIPAYSPEARGRSERMFGTLQKRLPQELRLAGVADMEMANRFLRDKFLPEHNACFSRNADIEGTAFVPLLGFALNEVLCVQEERIVEKDNTVKYKGKIIQILENAHRFSYAKCKVSVHEHLDGSVSVFHGPRKLDAEMLPEKANKDEDFTDEFIAFDPSLVWENAEGEDTASPSTNLGYRHGAQVALQRSPIPRTIQAYR